MKKILKNKGITLIALVITIIVLLIIAGVSIAMLTGENGLLTKVDDARTNTTKSNEEEQIKVQVMASYNDEGVLDLNELEDNLKTIPGVTVSKNNNEFKVEYIGGNSYKVDSDGNVEPNKEPIGIGNIAEYNGTVDGNPANYSNPIIPKGFKAINEGEATWGTESGYQNGLVIEDAVTGSETLGSQFVWVPVEDYENKFHLIDGFYNSYLITGVKNGTNKEAGSTSTGGLPLANNNVAGTNESIKMYKSVKENGGFYIARYEAGINGTTEKDRKSVV